MKSIERAVFIHQARTAAKEWQMRLKISLVLVVMTIAACFVIERTALMLLGAVLTAVAIWVSRVSVPATRV